MSLLGISLETDIAPDVYVRKNYPRKKPQMVLGVGVRCFKYKQKFAATIRRVMSSNLATDHAGKKNIARGSNCMVEMFAQILA